MRNFFTLALGAMLHGMLAASIAPSVHGDCGCIWQQEYKSLHAAIKLGRHAQRYTAGSFVETGEILTRTCCKLQGCPLLCAVDQLENGCAGLSDLT